MGKRSVKASGGGRLDWLDEKRPVLLALALAVNLGLVAWVSSAVLRHFPNSGDEYAYLLTARIFAEGRWSVPELEPGPSFQTTHFLNDRTFYGKYPPGWPALLSAGCRLGLENWMNPLLGALTLIVLYAALRRRFSTRVANMAMLLSLGCPFYVFNSASLFSHASAAFFLTAAFACLLSLNASFGGIGRYVLFGALTGCAFLIRPATTSAFVLPLIIGAWFLVPSGCRARWTGNICRYGLPPVLLFMAAAWGYNRIQTGDGFVQPFELYDVHDRMGFPLGTWREYADRFHQNVLERSVSFLRWTGYVPLLAGLAFFPRGIRLRLGMTASWFLSPLVCLGVFHFFYWGDGTFQYGPRYWYEAYFLVLAAAAIGLSTRRRVVPWLLLIVVCLQTWQMAGAVRFYGTQVAERSGFYDFIRSRVLSRSVVLMGTGVGTMPERDFVRNGLNLDGDVLFARDLGRRSNAVLRGRFPERNFLVFSFDFTTREYRLRPVGAMEPLGLDEGEREKAHLRQWKEKWFYE